LFAPQQFTRFVVAILNWKAPIAVVVIACRGGGRLENEGCIRQQHDRTRGIIARINETVGYFRIEIG
jgi:hypothetical protein